MDMETCAEMMWRGWHQHRCTRKPGYGNGGLYCKQHAKQHPADDQETVTMYAAKQEDNSFDLVACEVFDVTSASLVIKRSCAIFGYSIPTGPTRLSTDDWQWFGTAREALSWIERTVNSKVLSLRADAVRMEQSLEPVRKMLEAEDIEQRVADAVNEKAIGIKRAVSTRKEPDWNEG